MTLVSVEVAVLLSARIIILCYEGFVQGNGGPLVRCVTERICTMHGCFPVEGPCLLGSIVSGE